MGICTPWVISAATLFWVVTLGVDRIRPLPLASRADSWTSRLKAPLIEPSARPMALDAPRTGSATAVPAGVVEAGPLARPFRLPLLGNERFVVLPSVGSTRALKPHCTPS